MVLLLKTKCIKNISEEWLEPEFLVRQEAVFHLYHAYLALPPTVLAFVLTSLYIAGVMRAINEHRVSRKFYALLLNRAMGDLLGCLASTGIIIYILIAEHSDYNIIQVFNTLFTGCYWSSMVCYVSIGLLKLLGIAKPLHYRKYVTICRVKALIYASWVVFAVLVFASTGATALVQFPTLSEWTGCTVEDCLMPVMRVRHMLTVTIYLTTILCFLITAELVRRARQNAVYFHRRSGKVREIRRRFRYSMLKLALNVSTFTVFDFPNSAWVFFWTFAPRCFFFSHVAITYSLMGVVRIILLVRIIVDCAIAFATDNEVRRSLLSLWGRAFCQPSNLKPLAGSQTSTASAISSTSSSSTPRDIACGCNTAGESASEIEHSLPLSATDSGYRSEEEEGGRSEMRAKVSTWTIA